MYFMVVPNLSVICRIFTSFLVIDTSPSIVCGLELKVILFAYKTLGLTYI